MPTPLTLHVQHIAVPCVVAYLVQALAAHCLRLIAHTRLAAELISPATARINSAHSTLRLRFLRQHCFFFILSRKIKPGDGAVAHRGTSTPNTRPMQTLVEYPEYSGSFAAVVAPILFQIWKAQVMKRLARFDVTRSYPTGWRMLGVQTAFGSLCGGAFIGLRSLVDFVMPSVAPFALIFPPVLVATLFGHWRAGVVALAICIAWSWFAVFSPAWSWSLRTVEDAQRLSLNAVSGLIVITFAEVFRGAVREAATERERQIAYSEMLRRELDHRTKNNLQLMQSLIAIQRGEAENEAAKAALGVVMRRLTSFTRVYSQFPATDPEQRMVPMRPYLEKLLSDLRSALFNERVSIDASIANLELSREAALAVGLYTNEALTNCAKYAFANGRPGKVEVRLEIHDTGWTLNIRDFGVGLRDVLGEGEGSELMEVLAQQAGGRHEKFYPDCGCNVRLTSMR